MSADRLLLDYVTSTYWRTTDLHYELTLPTRRIVCPVCGHADGRDGYSVHVSECQFNGGRLERYACPGCDVVFGPLKMLDLSARQLATEYRTLYTHYDEADSTESEIRAFRACEPRPGGLYLNWGCGAWSETIERLRGEGWDVWGYEPAAESTSPFIVSRRDQISARFDGIFSNNVIEHLRDPVTELHSMAGYLSQGGVMAHASPCFELCHEDTRFHLFFYLGRSMDVVAERASLEIVGSVRDGAYMQVLLRPRS
jgi:SAM-dependent methyltransferase